MQIDAVINRQNNQSISYPLAESVKELIDLCLHSTVAETQSFNGFAKCATYASVGAIVLRKLLHHPFQAVAGGQLLDVGGITPIVLFPSREIRRRARKLSEISRFHCWIEAKHYSTETKSNRLEIIDFSTRHDRLTAHTCGSDFIRNWERNFLWDWQDKLEIEICTSMPARKNLDNYKNGCLWQDEYINKLFIEHQRDKKHIYQTLADRTLAKLYHSLTQ